MPKPATQPDDAPADVIVDRVIVRYVGPDPVLAVVDGENVLIAPGDPILVTVEQLACNPEFIAWKD